MTNQAWTPAEKILFRIAFIFFILLIVPLHADWYARLASIRSISELFGQVSGYRTNFVYVATESGRWGFVSFLGAWGPALVVAVAGGLLWTLIVRKRSRSEYNVLYYWLRVLVRYRIAFGLIVFGLLKVFPMQMPFPTIESLNTDLGDYSGYKIYWQIVGVVQWYEVFLGWVEVVLGTLLFFRATTAIGAVLIAGVLYNISHSNLAYDGGVHVYSAYFVLLSLFLLLPYLRPLYAVLIKRQDTTPTYYYPSIFTGKRRKLLLGLNYAFILLFLVVSGYSRYDTHYHLKRTKEPNTPGLSGATGYYDVTEFQLNGKVIPFSPLDSIRWQHVVLEKYSTLVYKVNRAFYVDLTNGGGGATDLSKNYELAGIGGGKKFFYYDADTTSQDLRLQDKGGPRSYYDMYTRNFGSPLYTLDNNAEAGSGRPGESGARRSGNSGDRGRRGNNKNGLQILDWHYTRPSPDRIILSGKNETGDSIYAVLDRVDKKYPLVEGK